MITPQNEVESPTQTQDRRRDPKHELASFLERVLAMRQMSVAELRRELPVDRKTPDGWLKAKKWPTDENQMLLAKALGVPPECFRRLGAGASAAEELVRAFPDLQPVSIPANQPKEDGAPDEHGWSDADLETKRLLADAFAGDASAADAARLTLAAVSWELYEQRRKALPKAELWKAARQATEGATRHGYIDLVTVLQESRILVEGKQGIAFASPRMCDVVFVDWLQLHHTIEQYPEWIFRGWTPRRLKRFLVEAQRSKKQCLRLLVRKRGGLVGEALGGLLGSQVRDFLLGELEHAVTEAEKAFDDVMYREDKHTLEWGWGFSPTKDDPHWKLLQTVALSRFRDPFFPLYRRLVEAAERGCEKQRVPREAIPELVANLSQSPFRGPFLWDLGEVSRQTYEALLGERSVGVLSTEMWAKLAHKLWGPLDWDDDEDVRPEIGRTESLPIALLDELREEARSLDAPAVQQDIEKLLDDLEFHN